MTESPKPTIKPKRSAWQIVGILLILLLVLSLISGAVGVSAYNDANPVVERKPYEYGGYQYNSYPTPTTRPRLGDPLTRPGEIGPAQPESRQEVSAATVEQVKRYFKELKSDLPHLKASKDGWQTRVAPAMCTRGSVLAPAGLTYPPNERLLISQREGYESQFAATIQALNRQFSIWQTWNWKEMEIGHVNQLVRGSFGDLEVFVAFPKPDGSRIKIRFTLLSGSETLLHMSAWDNVATGEGSDLDVALSLIAVSTNSGRDRLLLNLRSLPEAHRQMDAKKFVEARKQLDIAARAQATGLFQVAYDLAETRYDREFTNHRDDDEDDYLLTVDRLDSILDRDPLNLPALMLQMQTQVLRGQYHEIEELARQYQSVAGPDADAIAWAGAAQVGLKQTEEAQLLFRDALKLDPHQARAIIGLLNLTPADEKRAFVDKLAKLKYYRELFHRLIGENGWYNEWKSLELLARAHGQRFPDDASGVCHLVQALMMQDQFPGATKAFQSALPKLSGEPRKKLLDQFLSSCSVKQRHREAYDAVPNEDRPKAFQRAMQAWDYPLTNQDYLSGDEEPLETTAAKFNSLLSAHEKTHPDDIWLSIYRAKQLIRDNDPTAAEKTFRTLLDRVKPTGDLTKDYESGYSDARRDWLLAKVQLGQTVAAYERFRDKTTFNELATECVDKSNSSELAKLLASQDKVDGKPLEFNYWCGELHWLKQEYEQCATQMKLYLDQPLEPLQYKVHEYQCRDHLIRSWVKSKKPEAALEFLEELEYPIPILKALALAASKNTEEAEALLLIEMDRSPFRVNQVYSDPDLGPLLKGIAFDRLRQKYPPPAEPKKKPR